MSALSTVRERHSRSQDGVDAAEAIAAGWRRRQLARRVVFETGRMAPMLYHGLR